MAQRSKEYKESQSKVQAKKEKALEIIAKREKEFKASRGGTPKMSFDDELTSEEKFESLNLQIEVLLEDLPQPYIDEVMGFYEVLDDIQGNDYEISKVLGDWVKYLKSSEHSTNLKEFED